MARPRKEGSYSTLLYSTLLGGGDGLLGGLGGGGVLLWRLGLLVGLLRGPLWEEHQVDVGQHSAMGDGHPRQQLLKLLVVADDQGDGGVDDKKG